MLCYGHLDQIWRVTWNASSVWPKPRAMLAELCGGVVIIWWRPLYSERVHVAVRWRKTGFKVRALQTVQPAAASMACSKKRCWRKPAVCALGLVRRNSVWLNSSPTCHLKTMHSGWKCLRQADGDLRIDSHPHVACLFNLSRTVHCCWLCAKATTTPMPKQPIDPSSVWVRKSPSGKTILWLPTAVLQECYHIILSRSLRRSMGGNASTPSATELAGRL